MMKKVKMCIQICFQNEKKEEIELKKDLKFINFYLNKLF
jgi:hypothetical protein